MKVVVPILQIGIQKQREMKQLAQGHLPSTEFRNPVSFSVSDFNLKFPLDAKELQTKTEIDTKLCFRVKTVKKLNFFMINF